MLLSALLVLTQEVRPAGAVATDVAPVQALVRVPAGALTLDTVHALELDVAAVLRSGEVHVIVDALHHAREPESMQATIWTMLALLERYGTDPLSTYLVNEREIWFVPCVNPDGYVYNESTNPGGGGLWRKNRRANAGGTTGVDLNRNYAFQWGFDNSGSSPTPTDETYRGTAAASEPEVGAL